jgi:hypothetical protein
MSYGRIYDNPRLIGPPEQMVTSPSAVSPLLSLSCWVDNLLCYMVHTTAPGYGGLAPVSVGL